MVDFSLLPGSFDLYEILVNYIFGGIFFSLVGWAIILLITGIMGRMSFQSILIILSTYFAVAMVGYIGALAAVPIFVWAVWYMTVGIINKINEMR